MWDQLIFSGGEHGWYAYNKSNSEQLLGCSEWFLFCGDSQQNGDFLVRIFRKITCI